VISLLASVGLALAPACAGTWQDGQAASAERDPAGLRVGHWIEVKGAYDGGGTLAADEIEVLEPGENDVLVGAVSSVARDRFRILGQVVHISERTEWREVEPKPTEGARLKVEGHYRSPHKYSARKIGPRGPGRDQVEGRVDHVRGTPEGLELFVGNLRVLVTSATEVVAALPLADMPLAPLDHVPVSPDQRVFRDEDDFIPGSIRLSEDLTFGGLIEWRSTREEDFNLDAQDPEDRTDHQASARGELTWTPHERFTGLVRGRFGLQDRRDQADPDFTRSDARLSEAYGYWSDALGSGLDLQVGRQDFDERREWLYDQNLDALRVIWPHERFRAELSASTTLNEGSDRDEHSTNLVAYVSNGDDRRHLAAYVVDRRDDRRPKDYPIHFGARALGEWLPDNKLWAEYSVLRGYADDVDLHSYAYDLGTTWTPAFLDPFNLTLGYAFGSGDDPATSGTNEGFRQTGLHDNNDKFAGVTSFRYYGELVDPELSNLGILTVGAGLRFGRRSSLDLVWHDYRQAEAFDRLRNADLDRRPDGVESDIGTELDLVLGMREWSRFDLELVAGRFEPGDAFPGADPAWLAAVQLRFRF